MNGARWRRTALENEGVMQAVGGSARKCNGVHGGRVYYMQRLAHSVEAAAGDRV